MNYIKYKKTKTKQIKYSNKNITCRLNKFFKKEKIQYNNLKDTNFKIEELKNIELINNLKIKNNENQNINIIKTSPKLPILKKNTFVIKKKPNLKLVSEEINYNNFNNNLNNGNDYLKLWFLNKSNLNKLKTDILIIQFEGILGEFFYNTKLLNQNEIKKKMKLKKNCLGIINNLVKFMINLNHNNSVFLIIKNKTMENDEFKNNIYNKIKCYICGIFEYVNINRKSIRLNTEIIDRVIKLDNLKISFIFPFNYDFNKKSQLDYHFLKTQNFKWIENRLFTKVIYIKNILLFQNKKFIKVNDNFFKINNNFYFKLSNILIKKNYNELNNLVINKNLYQEIDDFELNNINNYIHYQKSLCYFQKNINKHKISYKPEDLDKILFQKKSEFLKNINNMITNQRNSIYYDFINRNSNLLKKYIKNNNNNTKLIKDSLLANKKENLNKIRLENLEIKNLLKNCFYLI